MEHHIGNTSNVTQIYTHTLTPPPTPKNAHGLRQIYIFVPISAVKTDIKTSEIYECIWYFA